MDEAPWPTLLFKLPRVSLSGGHLGAFSVEARGFKKHLGRPPGAWEALRSILIGADCQLQKRGCL